MGLPAAAPERLDGAVRALHHVEGQGDGRVQDRGPGGAGQAVGHPEEPPLHELRQDVAGAALLLQGQHTQEGPGRAALLPVSTVIRGFSKRRARGWEVFTVVALPGLHGLEMVQYTVLLA